MKTIKLLATVILAMTALTWISQTCPPLAC
jgi:hypothetical protein